MKFSLILYGLLYFMRLAALFYPSYRKRLKEKNFTAQLKTMDETIGRYYTFKDGKILSGRGIKPDA